MKGMTTTFVGGLGHLLTNWQIYGMIAAGVFGMFLVQSAMNAAQLLAAQPGLTLADPVLSILWGVMAFHERIRGGWLIVPGSDQRGRPSRRGDRAGPLAPADRLPPGRLEHVR
jgi:hypothetical protein